MSDSIVLERSLGTTRKDGASKRQRVFIFLSRHGLIFVTLLLVMLLGAVNYNSSMAYVLVFLLSSLFMVCMLHTYKNLRGLALKSSEPAAVFAGQTACFPILLDNRFGPARTELIIGPYPKNIARKKRALLEDTLVIANVDADHLHRITIPIAANKRGRLLLGRLRITSTYPLGLFRAWSYMPSSQTCLVYPKPAGSFELPLPSEYELEEQMGVKTGTDDFVGFRKYRQGDSIRNIDWKAVARERGLLVKRFSGSGASKMQLSWEQTQHLGDIEQRLSQLCRWVLEADKLGYHYALTLPDASIELGTGEAHKHRCLSKLAGHGLADT